MLSQLGTDEIVFWWLWTLQQWDQESLQLKVWRPQLTQPCITKNHVDFVPHLSTVINPSHEHRYVLSLESLLLTSHWTWDGLGTPNMGRELGLLVRRWTLHSTHPNMRLIKPQTCRWPWHIMRQPLDHVLDKVSTLFSVEKIHESFRGKIKNLASSACCIVNPGFWFTR